jgi:hypothetical protein
MSKPFELTWFPPLPSEPVPNTPNWRSWDKWREWNDLKQREFNQRTAARLTNAELAAEAYRQMCRAVSESGAVSVKDGNDWLLSPADVQTFGPMRIEASRLGEIKRFATLPHASQADYQ